MVQLTNITSAGDTQPSRNTHKIAFYSLYLVCFRTVLFEELLPCIQAGIVCNGFSTDITVRDKW